MESPLLAGAIVAGYLFHKSALLASKPIGPAEQSKRGVDNKGATIGRRKVDQQRVGGGYPVQVFNEAKTKGERAITRAKGAGPSSDELRRQALGTRNNRTDVNVEAWKHRDTFLGPPGVCWVDQKDNGRWPYFNEQLWQDGQHGFGVRGYSSLEANSKRNAFSRQNLWEL